MLLIACVFLCPEVKQVNACLNISRFRHRCCKTSKTHQIPFTKVKFNIQRAYIKNEWFLTIRIKMIDSQPVSTFWDLFLPFSAWHEIFASQHGNGENCEIANEKKTFFFRFFSWFGNIDYGVRKYNISENKLFKSITFKILEACIKHHISNECFRNCKIS